MVSKETYFDYVVFFLGGDVKKKKEHFFKWNCIIFFTLIDVIYWFHHEFIALELKTI